MKIAAIIPSRYGSTRFDGKPLALISGKLMIQRVYEQARRPASVTDVVVATDDERIVAAVESFGGRALMTSDANRSGTDRVGEAAEIMGLADEDIVINIQGDQPALCPKSLDLVVAPFRDNPALDMSTLAFITDDEDEIKKTKECKVTFDDHGFALYFSRAPIPCARDKDARYDTYKHLGVYAYTYRFLKIFRELPTGKLESIEQLEQLRALEHGYRIKVVISPYDSPEVDLPQDIPRIEQYLKTHQETLHLSQ